MPEQRTCKHLATGKPWPTRPLAHLSIASVEGAAPEDTIDAVWALCAMCAGFYVQALRASEERGALPVPIDRANTQGMV
jgi:hypothetical protein